MANICETNIYIGGQTLPRSDFENYSTTLFDEWYEFVATATNLADFSLSLDVEEGSIKASGKIVATLGVLYFGIGQYGSFISGLQTIHSQVVAAGNFLGNRAKLPFSTHKSQFKIRNNGQSLSQLRYLFRKVEQGKMSAEEAMIQSKIIFGDELDEAPEFKKALQKSLKETKLQPEQESFEFKGTDGELLETPEKVKRERGTPAPQQPLPPPDQYRVEIWRESRKSKRNYRVVDIKS
ncbi:hypothetical protein HGG65_04580 [Alteromonadaceae bacterium A_SAG4]|nr:hypothetical protein [Alteromonadaceae bacterium A_SAG4]NKX04321.1 hypothetical protein [Alteromonadaceae bacterium A_SAG6]NKX19428.1 hypothetical protein [Alteromonadaceae bacterium A_SAG8]NKX32976.1 hypothetical protein [Alteromonadaceae bacterium A_SAG3]NKX68630.1 hypothetical protein [Alteromonadaceae bacterium A_SAG7]